jgi:BirA family biotin operon repressor/biotin-[acetyl-CoA-carboxylase] ligase
VFDEHVEFDERPLVYERVHSLASGQLAGLVLLVDGALAPCVLVLFAQLAELFYSFFGAHEGVKGRVPAHFSDLGEARMATPLTIERVGRVGSTQDEARIRYRGGPLLISATGQDAGRGRSGAEWIEADRAMAASLAFEPAWPAQATPKISLVAGLAVTDFLPESVRLKWPNDLVSGDLKMGGILTEASEGLVVVGLGLNIFWALPPTGMGAVHASDPGEEHSHRVAERWAEAFLQRIEAGPTAWGRADYLARCTTIGRSIEWEPAGSGVAIGIGSDGELLIDSEDGEVALYAGEVREVRPV